MNPSTNDFLAKDEDDEGDTCHQTCTFIGHRVCNPSLIQNSNYIIINQHPFKTSPNVSSPAPHPPRKTSASVRFDTTFFRSFSPMPRSPIVAILKLPRYRTCYCHSIAFLGCLLSFYILWVNKFSLQEQVALRPENDDCTHVAIDYTDPLNETTYILYGTIL